MLTDCLRHETKHLIADGVASPSVDYLVRSFLADHNGVRIDALEWFSTENADLAILARR